MEIREDIIYARQSVDRKDSISIESQIDFCKYELKGGSCKVFKDKGYSGKNTDRPEFQKLLVEIRKGRVKRVIVYKLDRISRSILDFATMMELFQQYDVEFVSSTEKFDTSTPMGRAIRSLLPCVVPHSSAVRSVIKIALFRLQMFLYCAYLPPGVFWAIIKGVSTFRRHPCPKRNSKPSTSVPNAARPAPAGWGAARPAARGIP